MSRLNPEKLSVEFRKGIFKVLKVPVTTLDIPIIN